VKDKLRLKFLKRYNGGDLSPLSLTAPYAEESLIPVLVNFIAAHPRFSSRLFELHGAVSPLGTRLGRGEILVWFIFNEATLGGSSTSTDIFINGQPTLEIKCATKDGDRYAHFMLGIDEVPASLKFFYRLLKLFEKNDRLGKLPLPQNFANISKSKFDELKAVSPTMYQRAEEKYFEELLSGPVGKKRYLIFDGTICLPIFLGNFIREQLKIERISGGLTRLSFKS